MIGLSSPNSTIGGGFGNIIDTSAHESTIGGGFQNKIELLAGSSTIAGGIRIVIGFGASQSSISGGLGNVIVTGATGGAIGGGVGNSIGASADYSSIPGGRGLSLDGNTSFGFLANLSGADSMRISSSKVSVFGNTDLWLANNDNSAKGLRFYEANSTKGSFPPAGVNYTAFKAGTQSADITYTLPAAALNGATSGTDLGTGYMEANSGGALSWRQSIVKTVTNLNFGTIAAQRSSDVTVIVTGAAVGDIVNVGVDDATVSNNMCYTAWVSATDTVTIRYNNYGTASRTPGTTNTFKIQVTK